MSSSGICAKTGVAQYLERDPRLHAHLSPFPQGALLAWTRGTWTTLEFLRNIDFSGAILFDFSCAIIKALPLESLGNLPCN